MSLVSAPGSILIKTTLMRSLAEVPYRQGVGTASTHFVK